MTTPQLPPDDTLPVTPDPPPAPDYYSLLEPRQRRFCDCLVANGGNQTQAYIAAGYSPESANANASTLAASPLVSAAIEQKRAELSARAAISQERIAAELMAVGLLGIDDILARGAKGILRVTDKLKALEMLAKWKRMFEHEATQGSQFVLIIQPPPGADAQKPVGREIPLAPGVTLLTPPDTQR